VGATGNTAHWKHGRNGRGGGCRSDGSYWRERSTRGSRGNGPDGQHRTHGCHRVTGQGVQRVPLASRRHKVHGPTGRPASPGRQAPAPMLSFITVGLTGTHRCFEATRRSNLPFEFSDAMAPGRGHHNRYTPQVAGDYLITASCLWPRLRVAHGVILQLFKKWAVAQYA